MKIEEALLNEFWVPFNEVDYNEQNNWSNPDIRPNKFDIDFEGWLKRIGNWGTIEYYYYNDEEKINKQKITKDGFLKRIQTNELLKLYGKFRVEIRHIYEMDFIREYVGKDTKIHTEIFKVYVHLKPELKKGLTLWTKVFN